MLQKNGEQLKKRKSNSKKKEQLKGLTASIFVKVGGSNFELISKEIGVLFRIQMVHCRIVRVLRQNVGQG